MKQLSDVVKEAVDAYVNVGKCNTLVYKAVATRNICPLCEGDVYRALVLDPNWDVIESPVQQMMGTLNICERSHNKIKFVAMK